eukprot:9190160-Pyramimonas_sp.AAC.1
MVCTCTSPGRMRPESDQTLNCSIGTVDRQPIPSESLSCANRTRTTPWFTKLAHKTLETPWCTDCTSSGRGAPTPPR